MSTDVRVEFLSEGFHEILTGEGVRGAVQSAAQSIADRANNRISGKGFNAYTYPGNYGGGRIIGVVNARSMEARNAEATDKVLSRAVM